MVFSSTTFLFLFLPLVLTFYYSGRSIGWRNACLLVTSLLFYAWGEGALVLIMLASIVVNHRLGLWIGQASIAGHRKRLLSAALLFNLGLLAFFKYANFLIDNLNAVAQSLHMPAIYLPPIHLPIGISFFTFQAIAYVMDVHRAKVPQESNVFRLGLYISLFPQLIAGPIVRYTEIREAIRQRSGTLDQYYLGTQRFVIGLAKKVLIADILGLVADQIFAAPTEALEVTTAWLGIITYAFQIYFDFSGYSDMAIGLGLLFGFQFPENFRYPYVSRSLREFWRRWHITLSTWFRDYLYIPLGGNRGSNKRTFFNLTLVFLLCGLWHGAGWSFIIWGLFHGLFLGLERTSFGRWLSTWPQWLQHIYLLLLVLIGWVFFRANDLSQAMAYLGALFGSGPEARYYAGLYLNREVILALMMALAFSGPTLPWLQKKWLRTGSPAEMFYLSALLLLFLWSLATILASNYQPFIYFRF